MGTTYHVPSTRRANSFDEPRRVRGASSCGAWPTPRMTTSSARGRASVRSSATRLSMMRSCSPWMTSAGAVDRRRGRAARRRRRRCGMKPRNSLWRRSAPRARCGHDVADHGAADRRRSLERERHEPVDVLEARDQRVVAVDPLHRGAVVDVAADRRDEHEPGARDRATTPRAAARRRRPSSCRTRSRARCRRGRARAARPRRGGGCSPAISGTSADAPWPGRSISTTPRARARSAAISSQVSLSPPKPWTHASGKPRLPGRA